MIINPQASHHFAQSLGIRNKTDKIDARMIYPYQGLIDTPMITVPRINKEAKTLSAYLVSYQLAMKQPIALENHREDVRDKDLFALLRKDLKRAYRLEEQILMRITAYIRKHPRSKADYQRLLTIPGIGKESAPALLYLFITYQGNQITALCGLDPIQRQSGTSVKGKPKISKHGSKLIRKVLYMPMLSAIQVNPRIQAFYQRLLRNHKEKKLAVIAAMRKMILIAPAIYQNKSEYVPV